MAGFAVSLSIMGRLTARLKTKEKAVNINGMTFDYINTSISNVVRSAESSLQNKISVLDADSVSATDLLLLQQEISKWTIMTEIQSTLVKDLSDAMKGIIQKSS